MFALSDAIIALPGGVGTLEELTEAITLKQLSLLTVR
jgi:predicted Rossmann-fold nucleotide-binding protein